MKGGEMKGGEMNKKINGKEVGAGGEAGRGG